MMNNNGFKVYDVESLDVESAVKIAEEMMNVNGAPIEIYQRTDNSDYDDVWDEDANPTYYNPIIINGFFPPQPLEQLLTLWGIDVENKIEVTFIRKTVLDRFGQRLLRSGDLLKLPYNSKLNNSPRYFRIDNAQESGNYRYDWIYFKCQATLTTGDITILPHSDERLPIRDLDEKL